MSKTEIHDRAVARLERLRRLHLAARAMVGELTRELPAVRDAAGRAEGELISRARQAGCDLGARWSPDGQAYGTRSNPRRLSDGTWEHREQEVRLDALDSFAQAAARAAATLSEHRAAMEAASARWSAFGPLVKAGETLLVERGLLQDWQVEGSGAILP